MASRIFLSPPHMSGEEYRLVGEVFDSNWIAPTGPMVTAFEEQLATLTGFDHVAALSSGTAALHLALLLSDAKAGDEVWCATMTFIGGAAPILYVGATPVFIDVERDGLMLDLDLLERLLEDRAGTGRLPKVIITTDLYGHVPDMARLAALKARYGFIWISDSAEAIGSYRDGHHAGKGADLAIYSFNGNKIITTSGGGALASDNEEWIERARFLSTQAREPAPHYEHRTYGYNYRLSNVCAAIGVGQLRVIEGHVASRRRIHEAYRDRLECIDGVTFTPEPIGLRANRWLTTISIDSTRSGFNREQARIALEGHNIESRPLWKPMHVQPVFQDVPRFGGEIAELAFRDGLCLPSGSAMSDAELSRVCEILLGLAN